jgi:hypothetical protein
MIVDEDGVPFGWEDALSEVVGGPEAEAFFDAAERGDEEEVDRIVTAAYERVYQRTGGASVN